MKIFISYRRSDTQWPADKLYAAVQSYVANRDKDVFMDVHDIPKGTDFVTHLETQVAQCNVLFALIGPGWLDARNEKGERRLDDPNDFVRIEIASALRRKIRVVPVMIDGTKLPTAAELPPDLAELPRRNGIDVRLASFDSDIDGLLRELGLKKKTSPNRRALVLAGGAGLLLAGGGAASWITRTPNWLYLDADHREAVTEGFAHRDKAIAHARDGDAASDSADTASAAAIRAGNAEEWEVLTDNGTGSYAGGNRAGENVFGIWRAPEDVEYAGAWSNYAYQGFGWFRVAASARPIRWYKGKFLSDVLVEEGEIAYWDHRSRFLGKVRGGEANGFGVMSYKEGTSIVGKFINGQPDGPCVQYERNGLFVRRTGIWRNGVRNETTPTAATTTTRPSAQARSIADAVDKARAAEGTAGDAVGHARESARRAQDFAARARAASEEARAREGLFFMDWGSAYGDYAGQPRDREGAHGVMRRLDPGFVGDEYAGAWTAGIDFQAVSTFGGYGVYSSPTALPDIKLQEGFFVENYQEGTGAITFRDNRIYKGDIVRDVPVGFGVTTLPNHHKLVGEHKNGLIDGPGIEYGADNGVVWEGMWRAGRRVET